MDRRTVSQNNVGGLIMQELSAPMAERLVRQQCSPYRAGPVANLCRNGAIPWTSSGLGLMPMP